MFKYIVLALLGFGIVGPAQARPVRCDSCVEEIDFRLVAEAAGPGTHAVYNLRLGTMRTWEIPQGHTIARVGDPSSSGPMQVANTPETEQELVKAHTLHVIGGGSLRPIFNVPVRMLNLAHAQGKTAHDVVHDYNLRAQIESAAASRELIDAITSAGFPNASMDLASIGTSASGLRDRAGMLVRLVMDDGSCIDIEVATDDTVGTVLVDTARTAGPSAAPAGRKPVVTRDQRRTRPR